MYQMLIYNRQLSIIDAVVHRLSRCAFEHARRVIYRLFARTPIGGRPPSTPKQPYPLDM